MPGLGREAQGESWPLGECAPLLAPSRNSGAPLGDSLGPGGAELVSSTPSAEVCLIQAHFNMKARFCATTVTPERS